MTQQHKAALHHAIRTQREHNARIAAEAIKLAEELAAAQNAALAVHDAGNPAGEKEAQNG